MSSLNEWVFFDRFAGKNIRIWHPEFSGDAVIRVGSYEIVDTCEPIMELSVERENISVGECTILHWFVDNVSELDSVYLNGEMVGPGVGDKQICPTNEATYVLRVVAGFGEITRSIHVDVLQPTAPTPLTEAPLSPLPLLCGQLVTDYVDAGLQAYMYTVLATCSNERILWQPSSMGSGTCSDFCRIYDPVLTVEDLALRGGKATKKLVGYSRIEPIASCKECGPEIPTTIPPFRMAVVDMKWEPASPRAFEPMTLILTTRVEGLSEGHSGYKVHIQFGEDFPYRTTEYWFDSEDPDSSRFLTPAALQEGEFEIKVSGLRFPMTFLGSLFATVVAKQENVEASPPARQLSISTSPQAFRHCLGASVKAAGLLIKVPESEEFRVKLTIEYLLAQDRMETCGNLGCEAHEMDQLMESYASSGVETLAALDPLGRELLLIKDTIEMGFEEAKCWIWLRDFVQAWLGELIGQNKAVNGIITESPVYPLVVNAAGQRTGFLENGQIVEEIPGSGAVVAGESRIVLYPGLDATEVNIVGYASGTMNLHATFAGSQGTGTTLTYENVPVAQGMKGSLSSGDILHTLHIDSNGDGQADESRSPNQVEAIAAQAGSTAPASVPSVTGPARSGLIGVVRSAVEQQPRLAAVLGILMLSVVVLSAALLMVLVRARGIRRPVPASHRAAEPYGPVPKRTQRPAGVGRPARGAPAENRPGARPASRPQSSPGSPTGHQPSPVIAGRPGGPSTVPPDATHTIERAPRRLAALVDRSRPQRRYDLNGTMAIGRGQGNQIVLDHPTVSRKHAWLKMQGEECWIFDIGSTNGTYVNNQPVRDPRRLRHGDVVRFGEAEFVFVEAS